MVTQLSTGLGVRNVASGVEAAAGDFSSIPIIDLQASEEKIVADVSVVYRERAMQDVESIS